MKVRECEAFHVVIPWSGVFVGVNDPPASRFVDRGARGTFRGFGCRRRNQFLRYKVREP